MAKRVERLHIMQLSGQGADSSAQTRADLEFAFDKDPDFINFTEMGSKDSLRLLMDVARERHYRVYKGDGGRGLSGDDCAIAIKQNRREMRFVNGDHVRVHPGQNKPENQGGRYGPKGITWAKVKFHGIEIYMHTAHWVHNQTDDQTGVNKKRATAVSQMMAEQVRKHGRRGGISFFSGDMNVDPDQPIYPREMFETKKLVTIWEDAGQRPTHKNRSIDVIGRYGADKRVDFVRYKVWPVQNSDHRPVSAWYDVTCEKKRVDDPDPNPDPNDPPTYNGGNQDWSDYTDNQLYDLPQAIDDSDTTNG